MRGFNNRKTSNLPVLLAASVGVFGLMVIIVVVVSITKGSQETEATLAERVVVVEKEAPVEMVDVLVPNSEIEAGEKLTPELFTVEKRAKIGLEESAITSFDQLRNQYARSIMPAKQIVSKELLTTVRPANSVIAKIPSGFRAVTINVNATSGVEGWANAGALVDVQWISDINGAKSATIIVQNAKILSAERQVEGAQVQNGQPIPTTATLLVTERDAQKISLATTGGQIMLHLRGSNDIGKGSAVDGPLTFKDLAGLNSNREEGTVDGYAKIRNPDGTYREISIINGKVVKS